MIILLPPVRNKFHFEVVCHSRQRDTNILLLLFISILFHDNIRNIHLLFITLHE